MNLKHFLSSAELRRYLFTCLALSALFFLAAPSYASITFGSQTKEVDAARNEKRIQEALTSVSTDSEPAVLPGLAPVHTTDKAHGAKGLNILSISAEGNSEVVSEHILSVVTSKAGNPVDENRLAKDAEAIYALGFFSEADYRLEDEPEGSKVIFKVTENPKIDEIKFHGNTVYKEETLQELCMTKPGSIFNRVFFNNDMQRVREKYQNDGYVMAKVKDVRIEGSTVHVYIAEPKIGEIIIQGNKRTKTYVISRQIKIKSGDLFNATKLRYTLGKLQGMGYFEDVNVGFEPSDQPDVINLVLTLAEAKTGKVGITLGYGSQSGMSGGISYNDNNWLGRGQRFGVGFELGDREQYWFSLEQPYMDQKVYAWRFGAYKRKWEDLSFYDKDKFQFNYNENRKGIYMGTGKKFSERSKLSWYLSTEWQDIEIFPHKDATPTALQKEQMESGKNFTVTGTLRRDNMDIYSPFSKGDMESINVEKGLDSLGGDWSYWKYWFEAKYYRPLDFLSSFLNRNMTIDDVPPILALRLIAGDSDGYLPWAVGYTMGGDSTLRGYRDKHYRGDQMFLFNSEFRMPVHKNASLVFFYDLGKAWDTRTGDSFDLGNLAKGYGLGVRFRTPIGNLRLDFAQGDDESRVHFGFGEMF